MALFQAKGGVKSSSVPLTPKQKTKLVHWWSCVATGVRYNPVLGEDIN